MQHQEWQELIPYYIAQTLPPLQKQAFESHLVDCAKCQQEIEEWRMIASAVWREADEVAHQLPPLSQEVYNRLNYRDRPPGSRYSANPPQQSRREVIRVQSRRHSSSVPITMVASITVALILGALLIGLAMRNVAPESPQAIAMQGTVETNGVNAPQLGYGGGDGSIGAASVEQETAIALGIIPTQETILGTGGSGQGQNLQTYTPAPFVTNTPFMTSTPIPTLVPPTVTQAKITTLNNSTIAVTASPTLSPQAPIGLSPVTGSGPYITLTPGSMDNGAPLCELFNPTNAPIPIYEQANYNSVSSGYLMQGEVVKTLVVSQEGWYFVVLPSMQRGWVAPQLAYLRGNCSNDVLWRATPTITPTTAFNPDNVVPVTEARVAVVNAAYADLYLEPNNSGSIIGAISRGEQYAIKAYNGVDTNGWVQIDLGDGRLAWVWSTLVSDYPADQVPATIVPTPTAP